MVMSVTREVEIQVELNYTATKAGKKLLWQHIKEAEVAVHELHTRVVVRPFLFIFSTHFTHPSISHSRILARYIPRYTKQVPRIF